jgi:S-DNA-T family DNA segregation ATPase FtsK/SpoIIIE
MKKKKFLKKLAKFGKIIEITYKAYGARIKITGVKYIPKLRRCIYSYVIMPGCNIESVRKNAESIKAVLQLEMFYPFQKDGGYYIALSKYRTIENGLINIIQNESFITSDKKLPIAIGYDFTGAMYIEDLAKLIHLIIIGPSGSGKSIALQCLLTSLIVGSSVDKARLVIFDVGAGSLSVFSNDQHLYHPIVTDVATGMVVMHSLAEELDRRTSYGEDECKKLPYLVCVIDEFDDLVSSIDGKKTKEIFINNINSIIRRGRKAKIILVLASHNPTVKNAKISVDLIVSRMAFKCANHYASATALDIAGAEDLPGNGAMLLKTPQKAQPMLLQGAYADISEIQSVIDNNEDCFDYLEMLKICENDVGEEICDIADISTAKSETKFEENLAKVAFLTLGHETMSASGIKIMAKIGNGANNIIGKLCDMGIVTGKNGNKAREVIPKTFEELGNEAKELLIKYGYDEEQIKQKIAERNNSDLPANDLKCLKSN